MRIPREAWWIAGLTVVALLLSLALGGGQSPRERAPVPSSYSSAPDGVKALYLTMQELGWPVHRLRLPWAARTLPARGTLLVIAPQMRPVPDEWRAVRHWVEQGHTLVFVQPDLQMLSLEEIVNHQPRPTGAVPPTQPCDLTQDVRELVVEPRARLAWPKQPREARRSQGFGPGGKAWRQPQRLDETVDLAQAAPVAGDWRGSVAAVRTLGKGRVVLAAGGWSWTNEGIARADNLLLALNAAGWGRAPVWFDEYHQGFGESVVRRLTPLPVKLAGLQLLLGLLVVMYARSRRFGDPLPPAQAKRARSEFLGTMTLLLRRGAATRLSVRTAYRGATARLQQWLGLAPTATRPEIVEAARRLSPTAAASLDEALTACERALLAPTLGEGQAVALVRRLDEAVRGMQRT